MSDHDNLPLPSSNPMEDLETISRNKFSQLFAPAFFEVRPVHYRDKGIDFEIELKRKKDNRYTNFSFAVQLKSISTVKANKDGSISLAVEMSNINYLLNYPMPSYYVLYSHSDEMFYGVSSNEIYSEFKAKYTDGSYPQKFSVRFSRVLDPELIDEIYNITFEHGTLLRRLSGYMKHSAAGVEQPVVIGSDREVYSSAEHIAYIDKFGLYLVNNFRFKEVIDREQKARQRTSGTPNFNLACGMAYFQRGSLHKSIDFLKEAEKEKQNFDAHLQAVLYYTLFNAKHLLGILSREEYDLEIGKIRENEDSGVFFEIDRAYDLLSKSGNASESTIKTFYASMRLIINKDKKDTRALVKAHAKILDAEESILFHDLKVNFGLFIGRAEKPLESRTYQQWLKLEKIFYDRLKCLASFAAKNNYLLGSLNLSSTRINWIYKKIYYNFFLSNYKNNAFDTSGGISSEDFNKLGTCCMELDRMADSYEILEDIGNKISTLVKKFEILLFMGLKQEALNTRNKVIEVIDQYEMKALKEKYSPVMNGNSQHEVFLREYSLHLDNIRKLQRDFNYDDEAPFDREKLERREQYIRWSIDSFFEFDLPDLTLRP